MMNGYIILILIVILISGIYLISKSEAEITGDYLNIALMDEYQLDITNPCPSDYCVYGVEDDGTLLCRLCVNTTEQGNSTEQIRIAVNETGLFYNIIVNDTLWNKDYNDLINKPTHLTNFTDNLGNRGYNSLSNFTNDMGYINSSYNGSYVLDTGDSVTGNYTFTSGNANNTPIKIRANVSQETNLLEIQKSTGANLLSIDPSGSITVELNSISTIQPVMNGQRTYTFTTGTGRGINFACYHNAGSDAVATMSGGSFDARLISNNDLTNLYGVGSSANMRGNGDLNKQVSINGGLGSQDGKNGTISWAYGVRLEGIDFNDLRVGTLYGFYLPTPTTDNANGGYIDYQYGLYMNNFNQARYGNYSIVTNAGNIVFNEGGDSLSNVRIEGDTDANLLFTSASTDKVGIGTSSPVMKMDIVGPLNVTGDIYYGGSLVSYSPLMLGDDICIKDNVVNEWVLCGSYNYTFRCVKDSYCSKKGIILEDKKINPLKYQECKPVVETNRMIVCNKNDECHEEFINVTNTVCQDIIITESNIDSLFVKVSI